jgi:hypothetical protein
MPETPPRGTQSPMVQLIKALTEFIEVGTEALQYLLDESREEDGGRKR